MPSDFDPRSVRFDGKTGLVPAIVQDAADGTVLMLGYMNAESLGLTLESKRVTFYSRSRARLWKKGESSGNTLELVSVAADCDGDALLVQAHPAGPTCHTGARSCFGALGVGTPPGLAEVLARLEAVIAERDRSRPAGSYTSELLTAGISRTAQKVAEEAVETALAAVSEPNRVVSESADLLYHLLVLWRMRGIESAAVAAELGARAGGPD